MPVRAPMTQIAERMFNTALLIEPSKAAIIAKAFGPRVFGDGALEVMVSDVDSSGPAQGRDRSPMMSILGEEMAQHMVENKRGYGKYKGVAIISITGTLVCRGAFIGESSGQTSYEGLRAQIKAAAADPEMKAIALEVDSFGGEAAGCFELADLIREVRAEKPVYAFLAENACSGGYCLASQASHITIPEFGVAGSIGVVSMHVDQSEKLMKEGLTVTLIYSGKHKVDGNSLEPISDEEKAGRQEITDKIWTKFASVVALGRGDKLTIDAALKTEAAVYSGADAVRAGLVDEVSDAKVAFDRLVEKINAEPTPIGGFLSAVSNSIAGRVSLAQPAIAADLGKGPEIILKSLIQASSPGCDHRADIAHQPEEAEMPKQLKQPDPVAIPANDKVDTSTSVSNETERAVKITEAVGKAGLPTSLASKLIGDGLTLEAAALKIIDAKAEHEADGGDIINDAPNAKVTSDGVDRMKEGMTKALMAKAGMEGGEHNEFTGMTLREMARGTLSIRGLKTPRGGAMAMASAVFVPSMAGGMHSTSDFGNILADVANISMQRGFNEAEETFEKFTSVGSLTDFKPSKRVGIDVFPGLTKIEEGAEFQYGTIGDFGESIVLATYGKMFSITRQTIINDDLGAFTRIPMKMGRAARRTIGDLVYAMIAANAAMSDTVALFHATHKNLAGSGAVPSEATINAGIVAMSTQQDRSANASALNIAPKFILANPNHRSAVLQSLNSEFSPDDTAKQGSVKQSSTFNTVHKAVEPIFDARLAANPWYLMADPGRFDTIEVAYLDGVTSPFLDQQNGWTVDGSEYKVRIDAGVAALAWEGMYKNAGA